MTKIPVFSAKTATKSTITFTLPKNLFGKINLPLLSQALHVYKTRSHIGRAVAKTRGQVSITKRKIYRQKGTGKARHGASSAPIFVGGGKAHGPTGLKKTLSLSKKMKRNALISAMTLKNESKKIVAVSNISSIKKTKEASLLLNKISKSLNKNPKKQLKFTLILSDKNSKTKIFFRNIKNISIKKYTNLNAFNVYFGGILIFDKDIFNKK